MCVKETEKERERGRESTVERRKRKSKSKRQLVISLVIGFLAKNAQDFRRFYVYFVH